mmetsp:Transcript_609/g.1253  ORF Transcript_609/g.1253 Transcript_609/m.1253 type:complete len:416 (-) Transcript_609:119-1366(-)
MSGHDDFATRAKLTIGGRFDPCMRRSVQSIVLYEADRCLRSRYAFLKPFQKKIALYLTAVDLVKTLDFLTDQNREEVMFRTNSSKQPVPPDLAWKRLRALERDIKATILPKMKAVMDSEEGNGKSHEELCELMLQREYEEVTQNSLPHPPLWEFTHYNIFLVYRMYYRGLAMDPNIFPAVPPRSVDVPVKRPDDIRDFVRNNIIASHKGAGLENSDMVPCVPPLVNGGEARQETSVAWSLPDLGTMTIDGHHNKNNDQHYEDIMDEERRALLKEVKDHTELLKEFEGIIPQDELIQRKKALYLALPPVPPPSHLSFGRVRRVGPGVEARMRKLAERKMARVEARQQRKKARADDGVVAVDADVGGGTGNSVAPNSVETSSVLEEDWEAVNDNVEEKNADNDEIMEPVGGVGMTAL